MWIRHARYRMGTVWEMAVWSSHRAKALAALDQAFAHLMRLEQIMSRFLPTSDVSRLAAAAGDHPVSVAPELWALLRQTQVLSSMTQGAFDVTVGPLVDLWRRAAAQGVPPTSVQVRCAAQLVDHRALMLDPVASTAWLPRRGMSIDLGAIGKGFGVDHAVTWLRREGYTDGWVNAGGTVRFLGSWPHGVPIRDPRYYAQVLCRLRVNPGDALSTSANDERAWMINGRRYGHLLDPRTGWPAHRCLSVTVSASSAALADALSTACFVLGPEHGQKVCEAFDDVDAFWCVNDEGGEPHLITTQGLTIISREAELCDADLSMA